MAGITRIISHLNTMTLNLIRLLFIALGFFLIHINAGADDKAVANAKADSLAGLLSEDSDIFPTFDSSTTLDDYLDVAIRRNPGLRSAFNMWVANLKKSDYEGALPDPVFGYGYFVESVETRVGPQKQRFSLRQSFPWFGTLGAKADMAFAVSQASYQRFQSAGYRLCYEVKAAYYDYYYLGRELQITRDNFELLKFWESVAQAKYKVGLKQHPDIIKAQVELGKLEDHLRTLQEQLAPKAARLRALLNLPENIAIPVPSSISVVETSLIKKTDINLITENNPALEAMQRILESRKAGEKVARRQSLPSFSIGLDYIQTGEAVNPDLVESGKDPWMISAGISLPIWFGKNKARKEEARALRRTAEYNLLDSKNRLIAMTEQVFFEYADALRKTQLYRDGLVPKAEQSLNASYVAYQTGETDFLNVLDAQRQLLDFQLTMARERTQLATKRAQLEMLSGTELDNYVQH